MFGQVSRTLDGFGNNFENPEWGSAGSSLAGWTGNGFHDSIAEPSGVFRPNPRLVSNVLMDQEAYIPDPMNLTEFVWVFGQFIDHDITLVAQNPAEMIPIKIPLNDEHFEPGRFLPFFRSYAAHGSGESSQNPRRYENEITAFIDASTVYGSDEERANWLRTFSKGRLKTSGNGLLPWNTIDGEFNSPPDPNAPVMDNETGISNKYFVAGDVRANEHPLLIAMHTLFVREHNRICDSLSALYPHWDDELLYQRARKRVGAIIQSITYYEWLPVMGFQVDPALPYDPEIDPSISNVFSAAAYRLGHTMITDEIISVTTQNDSVVMEAIPLKSAFFNPLLIPLGGGIEPYLAGIQNRIQQKVDLKVVDGVRNFLFGEPSAGGLDLAAMNIMRGRDRGLPDFNAVRENIGLERYNSLDELTEDPALIHQLTFLYGNVDNLDPWVGMLCEEHEEGIIAGELLKVIIERQFSNLLRGDRFYFERDPGLTEEDKRIIRNTRLGDVIRRNTALKNIREHVFIYQSPPEDNPGPELLPAQLDMVVYPVPFNDHLTVKFYLEDIAQINLTLFDSFGRKLVQKVIPGHVGENQMEIPVDPNWVTGSYFLVLSTVQKTAVAKLRKE